MVAPNQEILITLVVVGCLPRSALSPTQASVSLTLLSLLTAGYRKWRMRLNTATHLVDIPISALCQDIELCRRTQTGRLFCCYFYGKDMATYLLGAHKILLNNSDVYTPLPTPAPGVNGDGLVQALNSKEKDL